MNSKMVRVHIDKKAKLSLHQNPLEIIAFVDMNSDHFRVHLCVDLFIKLTVPRISFRVAKSFAT